MRLSLAAFAALVAAMPALAQREFGFDNRKASGQPYLSPEETVKRFKVAPEFEVKLFAGEPLLVNPIAFTIDEKGRVWAIECFEYPNRTPKGKKPRDRIVILEDTDGDGAADKRTVFAEGKDFPESFDLASGIEVGHGGVFVGAPPYLWFIENKDDRPGKFEILLRGFGSQDTHETLNTFQWGPDGWLYGLHGVFTQSNVKSLDGPETRLNGAVWRYHPKTKKFEVFAEGTSNPWGMDWRNTDGQFILCCCVIPHLFHIVPGGIYKRQAGASYNAYAYGYIDEICDHTFHRESGWAHAGLISLDVPHMPEKYRNSVIFGSIHGCSIKQNILKPNGSTYTASRGDDFLVSGDKNFRPINMKWGPLGDIYLIDWHDQNPCHQAQADSWDYERGRVYRIQLKGTKPKRAEDLSKIKLHDLAQLVMTGETPWVRRSAARLLYEASWKGTWQDGALILSDEFEAMRKSVFELRRQAQPPESLFRAALLSTSVRAHEQPDVSDHKVTELLSWWLRQDDSITWIKNWTEKGKAVTRPIYLPLAKHQSPAVRRELASLAGRVDPAFSAEICHALMARKEDANDPLIPHLVWYAYEKVLASGGRQPPVGDKKQGADAPRSPDAEIDWLAKNAPGNPFVTDHIVPKAVRRLVATGKPADLALCLKLAETTAAAARRKALEGLASALQGQTIDAPPAWAKLRTTLLAANDAATTALVNTLSVHFRDPQAFRRALGIVMNARRPAADRAEAARQIGLLKHPDSVKTLLGLARGDAPEAVKVEAIRGLAGYADKSIPQALIVGWKGFPPAVRSEVVNLLAGRREWAAALLSAVKEKVIDRTALTDNTITRIQAFRDRTLNNLIETAWGRSRPTPKDLAAQIDTMRAELAMRPGSFERGRKVFEAQCAKCHKFDGAGAEVGPPLDGAGRDVEYLLANVLDPNRVIGAPYFIRQVSTTDGQVLQGVLAEEDDRTLTLRVENGVLKKIARADIDGEVKVLEKSMMPEGLGSNMTVQDFRDLVRYAMAHPFLTHLTVDGQAVTGGVSGRVTLAPPAKSDRPIVVEAKLTATEDVATDLLIGCANPFEVKLDGKPIGTGQGDRAGGPDREAFRVTLPKGDHTLTLVVRHNGAEQRLYARFRDPDRKLRYPEGANGK